VYITAGQTYFDQLFRAIRQRQTVLNFWDWVTVVLWRQGQFVFLLHLRWLLGNIAVMSACRKYFEITALCPLKQGC